MPTHRDSAIIIGTGLWGLLTGVFLAARGRQVTFLEALDFIGGRGAAVVRTGIQGDERIEAVPGCRQQHGVGRFSQFSTILLSSLSSLS